MTDTRPIHSQFLYKHYKGDVYLVLGICEDMTGQRVGWREGRGLDIGVATDSTNGPFEGRVMRVYIGKNGRLLARAIDPKALPRPWFDGSAAPKLTLYISDAPHGMHVRETHQFHELVRVPDKGMVPRFERIYPDLAKGLLA